MAAPFVAAAAVAAALTGTPTAETQPDPTMSFLRSELGFDSGDLRHLGQGRAAIKSLNTTDHREVALAGAIRVAISPAAYAEALHNIVAFKRHEVVRQIGTFSSPPRVEDLAGLTLDEEHLDDLRECRVNDCDLQLSRGAIERVRGIRWSGADAVEQANRVMRQILTDAVTNYRAVGEASLMTYADERTPRSLADEFRAMVAAPPALLDRVPVLERHLAQFPRVEPNGAQDVIYWSKEAVGPKVVISVTHLAIVPLADNGPLAFAAASKHLYGTYYFDASLGLTLLLRDEQPASTVLVYANRSRVDMLDGFLGGLKRAVVRSRARAALEDTLVRIRTRMPALVAGGGR